MHLMHGQTLCSSHCLLTALAHSNNALTGRSVLRKGATCTADASSHEIEMMCRLHASLRAGLRLLLRSAGCVCAHYMAPLDRTLPLHWSPFGWLALVYEATQGDRKLAQLAAASGATAQQARLSGGGGSAGAAASLSSAVASTAEAAAELQLGVHPCFEESESDDGDLVVVQVCCSCAHACVRMHMCHCRSGLNMSSCFVVLMAML